MFQKQVGEKIKTHILRPVAFFFENHAVYEIMWKNIVDPGRLHMPIWLMRMVGWIQTHTQTMQYILLFHCNSGCMKAPQCYVIRTFVALLHVCSKQETT
jgi:hypothetical protein